jgi:hypothetical protein
MRTGLWRVYWEGITYRGSSWIPGLVPLSYSVLSDPHLFHLSIGPRVIASNPLSTQSTTASSDSWRPSNGHIILCSFCAPAVLTLGLQGNILIDDDKHIRIADFGLSHLDNVQDGLDWRALTPSAINADSIHCDSGSLLWQAPELVFPPDDNAFDGSNKSTATDVWALGCTIYEV